MVVPKLRVTKRTVPAPTAVAPELVHVVNA